MRATSFWSWLAVFCLQLVLVLTAGCGRGDLSFPSEYQAVFLDNGQVFFGKLGEADAAFLTLRDVYYVQRVVNEKNKEARNILVKRGSEWHGPDFMRLNTRHVVLIEPVAADSRVAQLIREAKAAPPSAVTPAPSGTPPPVAAPQKMEKQGPGGKK